MDIAADVGGSIGGALGLVKPTKAKLLIKGENPPKDARPIECMFNPTEYRLSQNASVIETEIPPKEDPPEGTPPRIEYKATSQMTLAMQLFFDDFASDKGDVTPLITRLLSWQKPTEGSLEDMRPSPPYVGFEWGNRGQLANFMGLLTEVSVTYTVFRKDGTPVQAKVDVTLLGDVEVKKETNPTSHSIDSRRVRRVVEGETLHSIAHRELGRPAYWRAVANLNGIDDPLRVRPGTALLIPALADAAKSR
jgi:hypothetical protein